MHPPKKPTGDFPTRYSKTEGRVMTKRKLTPTEKAAKKKRQQEYMTIFINGKQNELSVH
jgi:hypothetical protein